MAALGEDPLVAIGARSGVVCDTPEMGSKDGMSSKWGRKGDSDWATAMGSLAMMILSPMIVWFCVWSCEANDCSLLRSGRVLGSLLLHKPFSAYSWLWNPLEMVTGEAVAVWTIWLIAQFLLYTYTPGPKDHGQPTPAGYTLKYIVNGWNVWWFCHASIIAMLWFVTGFEAATIVSRNWMSLFWIANIAGFTLTVLVYIKAHLAPTHVNDNKWSGSVLYDAFMGVEHNPRLSSHPYSFDFKIFFNGRPGICAWTLINLCFAATQYYRFGEVTNSMMILNLLQALYVLDFFWNEGWYLRTIDICHEHMGFYLCWGDLVWLPFMYTLQGLFLSSHPVRLSRAGCIGVLALGLGGYLLFRCVNREKDRFRKEMKRLDLLSNGGRDQDADREKSLKQEEAAKTHRGRVVSFRGQTCLEIDFLTWGRPTRYLAARYHTGFKNEQRQSYLLLSGFWGLSRHMNYLGDLMLSLSFCLTCGFTHILPYFYIVFMSVLLMHRVARDDEKCRQKYGKVWERYCQIVRYKICPFVY